MDPPSLERRKPDSDKSYLRFAATSGPMTAEEREYRIRKGIQNDDSVVDEYAETRLSFHLTAEEQELGLESKKAIPGPGAVEEMNHDRESQPPFSITEMVEKATQFYSAIAVNGTPVPKSLAPVQELDEEDVLTMNSNTHTSAELNKESASSANITVPSTPREGNSSTSKIEFNQIYSPATFQDQDAKRTPRFATNVKRNRVSGVPLSTGTTPLGASQYLSGNSSMFVNFSSFQDFNASFGSDDSETNCTATTDIRYLFPDTSMDADFPTQRDLFEESQLTELGSLCESMNFMGGDTPKRCDGNVVKNQTAELSNVIRPDSCASRSGIGGRLEGIQTFIDTPRPPDMFSSLLVNVSSKSALAQQLEFSEISPPLAPESMSVTNLEDVSVLKEDGSGLQELQLEESMDDVIPATQQVNENDTTADDSADFEGSFVPSTPFVTVSAPIIPLSSSEVKNSNSENENHFDPEIFLPTPASPAKANVQYQEYRDDDLENSELEAPVSYENKADTTASQEESYNEMESAIPETPFVKQFNAEASQYPESFYTVQGDFETNQENNLEQEMTSFQQNNTFEDANESMGLPKPKDELNVEGLNAAGEINVEDANGLDQINDKSVLSNEINVEGVNSVDEINVEEVIITGEINIAEVNTDEVHLEEDNNIDEIVEGEAENDLNASKAEAVNDMDQINVEEENSVTEINSSNTGEKEENSVTEINSSNTGEKEEEDTMEESQNEDSRFSDWETSDASFNQNYTSSATKLNTPYTTCSSGTELDDTLSNMERLLALADAAELAQQEPATLDDELEPFPPNLPCSFIEDVLAENGQGEEFQQIEDMKLGTNGETSGQEVILSPKGKAKDLKKIGFNKVITKNLAIGNEVMLSPVSRSPSTPKGANNRTPTIASRSFESKTPSKSPRNLESRTPLKSSRNVESKSPRNVESKTPYKSPRNVESKSPGIVEVESTTPCKPPSPNVESKTPSPRSAKAQPTPANDVTVFKTPAIPSKTPSKYKSPAVGKIVAALRNEGRPRSLTPKKFSTSTPVQLRKVNASPVFLNSPASTIGYPTPPPPPAAAAPKYKNPARVASKFPFRPKSMISPFLIPKQSPTGDPRIVTLISPVADYIYNSPPVQQLQQQQRSNIRNHFGPSVVQSLPRKIRRADEDKPKISAIPIRKASLPVPAKNVGVSPRNVKKAEIKQRIKNVSQKPAPVADSPVLINFDSPEGIVDSDSPALIDFDSPPVSEGIQKNKENEAAAAHDEDEIDGGGIDKIQIPISLPSDSNELQDLMELSVLKIRDAEHKDLKEVRYFGSEKLRDGKERTVEAPIIPFTQSNPIIVLGLSNKDNLLAQRHTGLMSESFGTSIVRSEAVIKSSIPPRVAGLAQRK